MNKKLLLLDDVPAGRNEKASAAFNHSLYAELLRDVLQDNRSGICVGFFARWGQGKSTVVNLLRALLGERTEVVLFNAYQARGDSVRRQMLLAVLRQIAPARAEEFERFTQVVTPLEMQAAEVKERYQGKKLFKLLIYRQGDWLMMAAGIAAAISFGLLIYLGGTTLLGFAPYADREQAILGALVAVVVFFGGYLWRRVDEEKNTLLAYTQPVSDSQRLKYPEQFSAVFKDAVARFNREHTRRLVLVVDDLDRCEPGTVVEALASVRHFCHAEQPSPFDCQFLIPCDDKQMLHSLEADGYKFHEYSKTEALRKFFDVIIRMDEIEPETLADFAAVQAKAIGIDPGLARDMVDAGSVREPRKVKSLLNAYRLAREAFDRNEASGHLPPAGQLERLEKSLAVLVCLQELTPTLYEEIRDDPDPLNEMQFKGDEGPIARRILSGLGPVSIATVDILITKQYEPTLRTLAKGHLLSAADRAGRSTDLATITAEATPEERDKILDWLEQKVRKARSGARLRELLSYFVDIGGKTGWVSPAFPAFLEAARRRRALAKDALRLGDQLPAFALLLLNQPDADRAWIDYAVVENYTNAPDLNQAEERYLWRLAHRLPEQEKNRFRRTIEQGILGNGTPQAERLNQVARLLQVEAKEVGWEFHVELGEKLLDQIVQGKAGRSQLPALREIGARLVGSDGPARGRLLVALGKNGLMDSPQEFSEEFLKNYGEYFQVLHSLLEGGQGLDGYVKFFHARYWPWLEAQSGVVSRATALRFISHRWNLLPAAEHARLGELVGQWIWEDVDFAKNAAAAIDGGTDSAVPEGRDILRKEILKRIDAHARSHTALSAGTQVFLKTLPEARWSTGDFAEALLADKIDHLGRNDGARPDNLSAWKDSLKPLCLSELPKLREATTQSLATAPRPVEIVAFAREFFWSKGIPQSMASGVAAAILRAPAQFFGSRDMLGHELLGLEGFAEVAFALNKQLPAKGAEWMQNSRGFLLALSVWAAPAALTSREFQAATAEVLLTTEQSEHAKLATDLLAGHTYLTAGVKKFLLAWSERVSSDPALSDLFKKANERPEFSGLSA